MRFGTGVRLITTVPLATPLQEAEAPDVALSNVAKGQVLLTQIW